MTAPLTVSVHLAEAENAAEVDVKDHTDHTSPFVILQLGQVSVFLTDPAVMDAIEEALNECRALLAAPGEPVAR